MQLEVGSCKFSEDFQTKYSCNLPFVKPKLSSITNAAPEGRSENVFSTF